MTLLSKSRGRVTGIEGGWGSDQHITWHQHKEYCSMMVKKIAESSFCDAMIGRLHMEWRMYVKHVYLQLFSDVFFSLWIVYSKDCWKRSGLSFQ